MATNTVFNSLISIRCIFYGDGGQRDTCSFIFTSHCFLHFTITSVIKLLCLSVYNGLRSKDNIRDGICYKKRSGKWMKKEQKKKARETGIY